MQEIISQYGTVQIKDVAVWFNAGKTSDFAIDGGNCIKYKNKQIAVFNFTKRNEWFACQNVCPHKMEMVLSRGMIGSTTDIPKIACPLHKKTFSLVDGSNLNGEDYSIAVYPVKLEGENVLIGFLE